MDELRQIARDKPDKRIKKLRIDYLKQIERDYKMDDYQRIKEMSK